MNVNPFKKYFHPIDQQSLDNIVDERINLKFFKSLKNNYHFIYVEKEGDSHEGLIFIDKKNKKIFFFVDWATPSKQSPNNIIVNIYRCQQNNPIALNVRYLKIINTSEQIKNGFKMLNEISRITQIPIAYENWPATPRIIKDIHPQSVKISIINPRNEIFSQLEKEMIELSMNKTKKINNKVITKSKI